MRRLTLARMALLLSLGTVAFCFGTDVAPSGRPGTGPTPGSGGSSVDGAVIIITPRPCIDIGGIGIGGSGWAVVFDPGGPVSDPAPAPAFSALQRELSAAWSSGPEAVKKVLDAARLSPWRDDLLKPARNVDPASIDRSNTAALLIGLSSSDDVGITPNRCQAALTAGPSSRLLVEDESGRLAPVGRDYIIEDLDAYLHSRARFVHVQRIGLGEVSVSIDISDTNCCQPCTGPCCNSADPCCGSSDPCCGSSDPCCGSSDPCCGSNDPCCGNPDPCCGSNDPCCGVDCDDGDPCTSDGCDGGSCTHESDPCCGVDCDDNNPCTRDICEEGGGCRYEWICKDDEDPCTIDYCQDGNCHHDPKCDDENECTTDSCDGQTGECTNDWPCEAPEDPCKERACVDGECVIQPKTCDDGNECTTDSCDPDTGACINEWPCAEPSDPCKERVCVDGNCEIHDRDCDDGQDCTNDYCDPQTGCVNESLCDDGNPCTEDQCVDGGCRYTWFCDDHDPCTNDSCSDGVCNFDPIICDDGDPCTTDYCDDGSCVYDPIICDDGEPCTDDYCDEYGYCVYEWIECDDGDACTIDYCDNGSCVYDPIVCDDRNECTDDSCDSRSGKCVYTPITEPRPGCDCGESDPGPCNDEDDPGCGDSNCCTQNTCEIQGGGPVCVVNPVPAGPKPNACGEFQPGPCNEEDDPGCGDSDCCTKNTCECDGYGNALCVYGCAPCCSAQLENAMGCPNETVLIPNAIYNTSECDGTFCYSLTKTGGNAIVTLPPSGCVSIPAGAGVGIPALQVTIQPTSPPNSTANLKLTVTVDGVEKCSATAVLTVKPAMCQATLGDGAGCRGETIQIERKIKNTGPCRQTFNWTVTKTAGLAQVTPSPASGSVALDPDQEWDSPLNVAISGTSPAGTATLELEVKVNGVVTCTDNGIVTAVQLSLKSLRFSSDHGLMRDNYTDYGPTGTVYAEPEWQANPPRNNPISHTMGLNVSGTLVVTVAPATAPAAQYHVTGAGPQGFNFDTMATLGGGDNSISVTSTDTIENKIQEVSGSINWQLEKGTHTCLSASTGPHLAYITVGTPQDTGDPRYVVTRKRMERAVASAGAANSLNPHAIVRKVIQDQGAFDLNGAKANAWEVPDSPSDCQSIVRFTIKVLKMISVAGTCVHKNIYAIETAPTVGIEVDPPGGLNNPPRNHPTQPWILGLIDGGGGCNAFEAVAKFTACGATLYYAGGTTGVFTNKDDVLKVFDTMSWVSFPGGACTVQQVVFTYPAAPPPAATPPCP